MVFMVYYDLLRNMKIKIKGSLYEFLILLQLVVLFEDIFAGWGLSLVVKGIMNIIRNSLTNDKVNIPCKKQIKIIKKKNDCAWYHRITVIF